MRDEHGNFVKGGTAITVGTILVCIFGVLTLVVLIGGDPSAPAFLPSIILSAVGILLIVLGRTAQGK